nr:serine-aspartate repeat-containing protein I-like [Lytechinus pictus]
MIEGKPTLQEIPLLPNHYLDGPTSNSQSTPVLCPTEKASKLEKICSRLEFSRICVKSEQDNSSCSSSSLESVEWMFTESKRDTVQGETLDDVIDLISTSSNQSEETCRAAGEEKFVSSSQGLIGECVGGNMVCSNDSLEDKDPMPQGCGDTALGKDSAETRKVKDQADGADEPSGTLKEKIVSSFHGNLERFDNENAECRDESLGKIDWMRSQGEEGDDPDAQDAKDEKARYRSDWPKKLSGVLKENIVSRSSNTTGKVEKEGLECKVEYPQKSLKRDHGGCSVDATPDDDGDDGDDVDDDYDGGDGNDVVDDDDVEADDGSGGACDSDDDDDVEGDDDVDDDDDDGGGGGDGDGDDDDEEDDHPDAQDAKDEKARYRSDWPKKLSGVLKENIVSRSSNTTGKVEQEGLECKVEYPQKSLKRDHGGCSVDATPDDDGDDVDDDYDGGGGGDGGDDDDDVDADDGEWIACDSDDDDDVEADDGGGGACDDDDDGGGGGDGDGDDDDEEDDHPNAEDAKDEKARYRSDWPKKLSGVLKENIVSRSSNTTGKVEQEGLECKVEYPQKSLKRDHGGCSVDATPDDDGDDGDDVDDDYDGGGGGDGGDDDDDVDADDGEWIACDSDDDDVEADDGGEGACDSDDDDDVEADGDDDVDDDDDDDGGGGGDGDGDDDDEEDDHPDAQGAEDEKARYRSDWPKKLSGVLKENIVSRSSNTTGKVEQEGLECEVEYPKKSLKGDHGSRSVDATADEGGDDGDDDGDDGDDDDDDDGDNVDDGDDDVDDDDGGDDVDDGDDDDDDDDGDDDDVDDDDGGGGGGDGDDDDDDDEYFDARSDFSGSSITFLEDPSDDMPGSECQVEHKVFKREAEEQEEGSLPKKKARTGGNGFPWLDW